MPEDALYDVEIVDTRPVIEIEEEQHPMVPELLVSVEMTEETGGLSRCEILLDNSLDHEGHGLDFAFEHTETNVFALGARLRLLTGDAAEPTELFRGRISAVAFESQDQGQPRLRVFAEDALMSWRMVRRTRTYPAGPLRNLVAALAADTELTPVVTGLNDELDEQQQVNETNLGFLRRLLDRYDADAQVVGDELHVSPRAAVDRGRATLELGRQLRNVRVTADLSWQRARSQLSGFGALAGTVKTVSAEEKELGPGTGATGTEMVDQALPGSLDRLGRIDFRNTTEAQVLVDVAHRRRARRFVVAEGQATGNAAIRVGTVLTLEGLGARFSNDYYTVRACHRFDRARGYRTDFTAECAFLGRL